MEDEELDLETEDTTKNRINQRFTTLTEKAKTESARAESEAKARIAAEEKALTAEKERDFYSSFADSNAKYPGAIEYKDQIKEKVMAGYDVQDATIAVLAREGKLGEVSEKQVTRESPAGGSASTSMKSSSGDKPLNEMSKEEKRQMLEDADISFH